MSRASVGSSRAAKAREAVSFLEKGKGREVLSTISKTGMRNLVSVAQAASSLDEIELTIRYQQARSGEKKNERWHPETSEVLINVIRKAAQGVQGDSDEAHRARALAAAEVLGLIARAHRVIHEQNRASGKGERS